MEEGKAPDGMGHLLQVAGGAAGDGGVGVGVDAHQQHVAGKLGARRLVQRAEHLSYTHTNLYCRYL